MSRKTLIWLLTISLILNISTISTFCYYQWIKPKFINKNSHHSQQRESFAKKLGLTEEQSNQMTLLRDSLFAEIKPLKNTLRQQREELFTLLSRDSISAEEINAKLDQILILETAIHKKMNANLLKHRLILSAQQYALFLKTIKSFVVGTDRRKERPSHSKADSLLDN